MDVKKHAFWWLNSGGVDPGLLYLQENAHFYYDFTNLTGVDAAAISNGNAGLVDLGPSGNTATIINTPVIRDLTIGSTVYKTLKDYLTQCVSTGNDGSTWFNQSFELHFVYQTQDWINATVTWNLVGGIVPTNLGVNVFVSPASSGANAGTLSLNYGNSDGLVRFRTNSSFAADGVSAAILISILVDFENDVMKFWKDGVEVAASQDSGTMSSINPANYNNTQPVYVGALNNNGTAGSNADVASVVRAACLPKMTDSQRAQVMSYLINL